MALETYSEPKGYQSFADFWTEGARTLLTTSDIALAEIALASGLSSQNHMNDIFRKKAGTTSGRFRREAA